MFLKIAILNNSGNVGKSMICDNLLRTRIPNIEVIKVETVNSDGTNDNKIPAKQIKKLFDLIDTTDVALMDIGSSNIVTFMENLKKTNDAHEDINYFIVPTTPKTKQQVDTLTTIEDLLQLGIDKDQIKVIFNFHDPDITIQENYSTIFNSVIAEDIGLNKTENQFTITDNPAFDMLGELGYTFMEIANDPRDFKLLIRASSDKNERSRLSHLRSAQRLARGFMKELDVTFNKLAKSCNFNMTE